MPAKRKKRVDLGRVVQLLTLGVAALLGWFLLGWLLMRDQLAVWLFAGLLVEVLGFWLYDAFNSVRDGDRRSVGPASALPSETGRVTVALAPVGKVRLGSELWTARSQTGATIAEGTEVEVVSRDGLTVIVDVGLDERLRGSEKLASPV